MVLTNSASIFAFRSRWRLRPGIKLIWRCWSDERVVFNTGSGESHLLNLVEAETLRCLEESVAEFGELVRQVAAALNSPDAENELEEYLKKLLVQFEDVGLVESVKP